MVGERAEVCGWGDLTCSVVCRMCDVCCVFGMFEVFQGEVSEVLKFICSSVCKLSGFESCSEKMDGCVAMALETLRTYESNTNVESCKKC